MRFQGLATAIVTSSQHAVVERCPPRFPKDRYWRRMEGLSPGVDFYNNLESIIQSRQRFFEFNTEQTKRELESQELLKDCFTQHERLFSWLWNHISDLQMVIASLQEEHDSRSPRKKIKSLRRENPLTDWAPDKCLLPETPPLDSKLPPLSRRTEDGKVIVIPDSPDTGQRVKQSENEHQAAGAPESDELPAPIVSFSQRLLERKNVMKPNGPTLPTLQALCDSNSENSTFSNTATQSPHSSPLGTGFKKPLRKLSQSAVESRSFARPKISLIGSAVTPYRTEKKTSSEPPATSVRRASEPNVRPVTAPAELTTATGRLKKKRQKRKRPRLQLRELAPEAADATEAMQETLDEIDLKREPAKSPVSKLQENSIAGHHSRRERLSSIPEAENPTAHDPSNARNYPRKKRLSFSSEAVTPAMTAEGKRTTENGAKPTAGPNLKSAGSAPVAPSTKTPRFDGFKTPAAIDRAARAVQQNFRRKEDCAAKETVLGNARAALTGYACHECEDFLRQEAAGFPNPEAKYRQFAQDYCKHRAKQPPPATPPNYWKLTFDETQTQPPK